MREKTEQKNSGYFSASDTHRHSLPTKCKTIDNTIAIYLTFTRAIILTGDTDINIKEDSNIQKRYTELLTHFSPVSHFYIHWERQKTFGFLTFSGSIEMWNWAKMG